MKHGILCALLLTTALVSAVDAGEETVFAEVLGHYEAIRLFLIEDSTGGVADHAEDISEAAIQLQRNFSSTRAGVKPDDADAVESLLPEIIERAARVGAASDLESTRTELAELTKPLVRWHALVDGDRPVVAYCPMEKKAWLQPDEPIGNPYAPYMLRCGGVVQR